MNNDYAITMVHQGDPEQQCRVVAIACNQDLANLIARMLNVEHIMYDFGTHECAVKQLDDVNLNKK